MKGLIACLAAASTVLASEKVFNIHDDLDAFPHVSTAVSWHCPLLVESNWWMEDVMDGQAQEHI